MKRLSPALQVRSEDGEKFWELVGHAANGSLQWRKITPPLDKDVPMFDWKQLVLESDAQLATHDIAEVHFACAAGLPGAERIDIPEYLRKLDSWAWQVQKATNRLTPQFEQQPGKFGGSRGYFQMLVLVTVLQRDLGIRATDKLNGDTWDFSDSRDLFLHGLMEGCPGTCSSLPVLCAAIGRRLNYPLRLMARPEHLFVRWDEPGAICFNIECTATGFFAPSDAYYQSWPKPMPPYQSGETYYMKSLTPREELSGFLIQRAYCSLHNGRHREAFEASCWSHELAPHHSPHIFTIRRIMGQWEAKLRSQMPPPFPSIRILSPRRRFARLPQFVEDKRIYLEALDTLWKMVEIQRACQTPIRRSPVSGLPLGLPDKITVDYSLISGEGRTITS